MATSSIIEPITIEDPEFLVEYAKFMEARAKEPFKPRTEDQKSGCITDPEEIRRICELCLGRKIDKHSK